MVDDYQHLNARIEGREDDVFWIELDNGDLNLVDSTTHEELADVFEEVSEADVRIVVLTGTGDVFSGGGDVEWMQGWIDEHENIIHATDVTERLVKNLVNIKKPVIARVNGDAAGLGANIVLFSDIVIATENASIGDPHVKVGLSAGDGGPVVWPLQIGLNRAKEFLLTGEMIDAETAEDWGLYNYAVPEDELDGKVDEFVEKIARLPQPAVRFTKESVNRWLEGGVQNILRESLIMERISADSADHEEAVAAFRERREANPPEARSPK